MKRPFSWLSVLLAAIVLLSGAKGQAQIVKLPDLTQSLLRERTRSFLARPEAEQLTRGVAGLIRLDADQITYAAAVGKPVRLLWAYQPLRELASSERDRVREVLREVLIQVFGNHLGGLLSDADAQSVFEVASYTPASPVPEGKGTSGRPQEVVAYPVLYGVVYCPWGYCCQAIPVYTFYYYTQPLSIATTAARPSNPTNSSTTLSRSSLGSSVLPVIPKSANPSALYGRGVSHYWNDEPEAAREFLTRAVEKEPHDARFWYFKALAEKALGDDAAARSSARRGAALELLNRTNQVILAQALERVQGANRQMLGETARVGLTVDEARRIVSAPLWNSHLPAAQPTTTTSK